MKIHCLYDKLVPISELKLNPKNRNTHPESQIKRLAQILLYQGWRYPVKVSKASGMVTSGHGRVAAALANGWADVPVNYQEYDNAAQEYADTIADNSIASWAELDSGGVLQDLKDYPDLDIELLGIEDFDIGIEKLEPGCDEDEVPETVEPKTKIGDIYTLGNHRLMCGDSTSIDAVEKLMNGEKADMVFTDPPYNHASEDSGLAASVSLSHRRLMNSDWDKNFDIDTFLGSIEISKSENCTIYICASHHTLPKILNWQKDSKATLGGLCVWVKPNPMPSLSKRHWTWDKEYIAYSTYGKHVFNFSKEGHTPSCWHINKNQKNDLHPTMKPVEVPEHAIIHSSNEKNSILDLFGGSGSTLIACEKTNRRCFMMELDTHYCDVIVARWEKYTGKKSILESHIDG